MCRARVAPRASVAPRRRVTARAMTRRDVVTAHAAVGAPDRDDEARGERDEGR